jgi:hypothetical protein
VACHRAGVTEAEVHVLVAVDVAEARPGSVYREDRETAGPANHPLHRNAAQQRPFRALAQLGRARMLLPKALELALHEAAENGEGHSPAH